MKTKLTYSTLCFCSSAFSEIYVLVPHNPESGISKKVNKEGTFFTEEQIYPKISDISVKYEILKESEQLLFLVNPKEGYVLPDLEYILINKIDNNFRYGRINIFKKKRKMGRNRQKRNEW